MDGFRWNYMDNTATPNFDDFARHGVKLPYMNNSFVTKTFPNHYTIVTGMSHEQSLLKYILVINGQRCFIVYVYAHHSKLME